METPSDFLSLLATAGGVGAGTVKFASDLASAIDSTRAQLGALGFTDAQANALVGLAIERGNASGTPPLEMLGRLLTAVARDPEGVQRGLSRG